MGIKEFVRDVLGCQCPDEVFRDIGVCERPREFEGLTAGVLWRIGGRLLVLIVPTEPGKLSGEVLAELMTAGCRLRDSAGFNRFRLVLATHSDTGRQRLTELAGQQPITDEKTHLHVVRTDQLPPAEGQQNFV